MRKSNSQDYYGVANAHAVAQLSPANGVTRKNNQKPKKLRNGAAGDFQVIPDEVFWFEADSILLFYF